MVLNMENGYGGAPPTSTVSLLCAWNPENSLANFRREVLLYKRKIMWLSIGTMGGGYLCPISIRHTACNNTIPNKPSVWTHFLIFHIYFSSQIEIHVYFYRASSSTADGWSSRSRILIKWNCIFIIFRFK